MSIVKDAAAGAEGLFWYVSPYLVDKHIFRCVTGLAIIAVGENLTNKVAVEDHDTVHTKRRCLWMHWSTRRDLKELIDVPLSIWHLCGLSKTRFTSVNWARIIIIFVRKSLFHPVCGCCCGSVVKDTPSSGLVSIRSVGWIYRSRDSDSQTFLRSISEIFC